MTATDTWTTNLDNHPVLSERLAVKTTGQEFYSNRNLAPYVAQPGWVIEAPEYSAHPYNKHVTAITDWVLVPEQVKPGLMRKLLEADTGLYRARWLYQGGQNEEGWLYPDSMSNGDVLHWDHSRLQALFDPRTWVVEYLSLSGSWRPQVVTEPLWVSSRCFRIRQLSSL